MSIRTELKRNKYDEGKLAILESNQVRDQANLALDELPAFRKMLEMIASTTEKPVNKFVKETENVAKRIVAYRKLFKSAPEIYFVFGCDDGRVGAPPTLQNVNGKQVLMVYVPRIGGGVPNKDLVQFLHHETIKIRGSVDNVQLIVTQHGSNEEVDLACDHVEVSECTCGLRAVFAGMEDGLRGLGGHLRREQRSGCKELNSLSEHTKDLLTHFSKVTGIPKRLIRIAAETNFSSNITNNARNVAAEVVEMGIFDEQVIHPAYFNHNSKEVKLIDFAGLPTRKSFEVSDDKWEDKNYQDPRGLVISFGPQASFTPDGIILPESVGNGINNDFTAVAPAIDRAFDQEDLLNALSEVWYAAKNHKDAKDGHPHGENFKNVEYCAILCDDDTYVQRAKEILRSEEFGESLRSAYESIRQIQLVNIQDGSVKTVDLVNPETDLKKNGDAHKNGVTLRPRVLVPFHRPKEIIKN